MFYSLCGETEQFIHVTDSRISFFFVAEYYSIFFTHSSVVGHVGRFHVLTIVNSAAVIMEVQISSKQWLHFIQLYTQKWNCWIIFYF